MSNELHLETVPGHVRHVFLASGRRGPRKIGTDPALPGGNHHHRQVAPGETTKWLPPPPPPSQSALIIPIRWRERWRRRFRPLQNQKSKSSRILCMKSRHYLFFGFNLFFCFPRFFPDIYFWEMKLSRPRRNVFHRFYIYSNHASMILTPCHQGIHIPLL